MLKIDNLDFSYNQSKILKMISFFVEKQEFVGIIGPNGSGKTTLLKNISNIIKPDKGFIYLNNELLNNYTSKELAKIMALVPQDTSINFNFSVYDLIMMGRNPYQNRWGIISLEDKKIVEEAMTLTDTSKFSQKKITELSGGERQRVIIARALVQKPELLLLDEPTASLDINYQGEIFDLLANLNNQLKLTIVLVSHDLNLTSQYCTKLILLNNGMIFQSGTPVEVLTAENIRNVYQTEVIIKENPFSNRPYVILVPKNSGQKVRKQKKEVVHVICGGGSGKNLLKQLTEACYTVSCGILNQGDSDWEMASILNLEMAEIPPFAAISANSLIENQKLIKNAEFVILSNTPFGFGNLANLELLSKFSDKKIILLNDKDISERDFTKGKAKKYWDSILNKKNTYLVKEQGEILPLLEELKK